MVMHPCKEMPKFYFFVHIDSYFQLTIQLHLLIGRQFRMHALLCIATTQSLAGQTVCHTQVTCGYMGCRLLIRLLQKTTCMTAVTHLLQARARMMFQDAWITS